MRLAAQALGRYRTAPFCPLYPQLPSHDVDARPRPSRAFPPARHPRRCLGAGGASPARRGHRPLRTAIDQLCERDLASRALPLAKAMIDALAAGNAVDAAMELGFRVLRRSAHNDALVKGIAALIEQRYGSEDWFPVLSTRAGLSSGAAVTRHPRVRSPASLHQGLRGLPRGRLGRGQRRPTLPLRRRKSRSPSPPVVANRSRSTPCSRASSRSTPTTCAR
jgi:hypothetical protein